MISEETFKDLLPKFIKHLEDKGRSPSTIVAYKADLEQLINFLQKKNKVIASQLMQSDIEIFRDSLLAEKFTPKTVSRKLNAIKTFFRWMLVEKFISSNPTENVSHPKIEFSLPKHLAPIEYRALRDVVRDDIRILAIIELILQLGLRISEVANIKISDIKNNQLTIQAYATQPQRTIPLNSPAKEALDQYLKIRPKSNSDFVFVSKTGRPLAVRNIRAAIDRYMQKAEIGQYSVNDLRTTFIVENLKAGVSVVLISELVGHKRFSTTEKYLELAKVEDSGNKTELIEL